MCLKSGGCRTFGELLHSILPSSWSPRKLARCTLMSAPTARQFVPMYHLKHRSAPLVSAILVSWLIALGEYCFQVLANRLGYGEFTGDQLKIIQEVITLIVFCDFCLRLFKGTAQMELRRCFCVPRRGRNVRILGSVA
jgi:uncharacterized protein (DUF486 family)